MNIVDRNPPLFWLFLANRFGVTFGFCSPDPFSQGRRKRWTESAATWTLSRGRESTLAVVIDFYDNFMWIKKKHEIVLSMGLITSTWSTWCPFMGLITSIWIYHSIMGYNAIVNSILFVDGFNPDVVNQQDYLSASLVPCKKLSFGRVGWTTIGDGKNMELGFRACSVHPIGGFVWKITQHHGAEPA